MGYEFFVAGLLGEYGAPEWCTEYCFAPDRKWRFDFAWPEAKVALEIEGGAWVRGRHNRPQGFIEDARKYNAAAAMGWLVFRAVPPDYLTDVIRMVVEVVKRRLKSAGGRQ